MMASTSPNTRICRGLAAAGIGIALSVVAAAAQSPPSPHDAQPERPTVATHAGTVAPGWFEIESGIEADRAAPDDVLSTPTLLKFGIASHLQFDVMLTSVRPSGGAAWGIGDAGVAVKWRLLDHAPVVGNFALQPSLKFPTGSPAGGTGTGTTDVSLLAISSHVLGPVALDINVGYTRRNAPGAAAHGTLWTVSTGTTIAGPLALAAEVFSLPAFGGRTSVGFLAGPTCAVRPWLVIDAGFIADIAGDQLPGVYAGVTWNTGRLW